MNYYNEFDPRAAAWLRELIKEGHLPKGHVDERSITEVNPGDLTGFTQCHFFAGIGGWFLALSLAGWPEDRPVWTGSCPCQPFSAAGKGLGTADERHLWPQFQRLIGQCNPPVVLGEQVASKAGRQWLSGVCADLEALGYDLGAADLCAAGVGAPHIRQRLYWVADNQGHGREQWRTESNGRSLVCDSADGRLAQSDGGNAGTERQQRGGEQRQQPQDSGPSGRMVNLQQQGLEGYSRHGDHRNQSGRIRAQSDGSTSETGDSGGMADTDRFFSDRTGLGTGNDGRKRDSETKLRRQWDQSKWINCRDGKQRRIPVEPEFSPLAHGVPGRVGLLRGYGNAIVPQLAAEFIQAYLETENETTRLAFLE